MANSYFTLNTTTLGTMRFRSKWSEDVSARGINSPRTITIAVDSTVNATFSAKHQRIHNLTLVFDGDESTPVGTYANLVSYYEEGVATFVDWDGTTTYSIVFMNPTIMPLHLSPILYPMEVPVQFMEMTST